MTNTSPGPDSAGTVPAGKVPVIACVVASWKFLIDNWRPFLPAALIIGAVAGISPILLASGGLTVGEFYLFPVIAGLASVFCWAVILRKAVRNEFLKPTGLAFGQDEARLLGVLASIVLLLLPAAILSGLVYFFILIGSMGLTPEQMEQLSLDPVAAQEAVEKAMTDLPKTSAGATLGVLAMIGAFILLLIYARIWVVSAATIGERKIVFFQTWGWSKGNVLRIAAAILMTWAPAWIGSYLIGNLISQLATAAPNVLTLMLASFMSATIGAFAAIPPTVLGAELYRGLRPPGFVAK
jgi:hypothetical protein